MTQSIAQKIDENPLGAFTSDGEHPKLSVQTFYRNDLVKAPIFLNSNEICVNIDHT